VKKVVLVVIDGLTPSTFEAAAEGAAPARESAAALLRRYRGAAALCLVTFLYWSGVNAVLPLVSIYTRDILGATVGEAQLLPALLLAATTAAALPVGFLGERFGKRRVIAAGYVVMCLAALAGLVVTTKEQGAVVFLLAGFGNAAGVVLTLPLLADMVPRHHMGKATGLLAAAGSVAAPLSSLVAGSLADRYGPRAIFTVMAVMVALALAALPATLAPRRSSGRLAAALGAG
jgi:DHA1 family bicyclomycin/chloramphenicol resistance-like MFS transporter